MAIFRHPRFWLLALAGIVVACEPIGVALEAKPEPGTVYALDNDIADNAQPPRGLRRVEQFTGDTLLNVLAYDQQGRVVFKYYRQYVGPYWPGGYLTMITGNVYAGNRLVRRYELHSNVGIKITDYDYGWWGRTVREYVRETPDSADSPTVNTNPFRTIARLQDLLAVLHSPLVQAVQAADRPALFTERRYGAGGVLQEELFFGNQGEETSRGAYAYNTRGLCVEHVTTNRGERDQLTRYAYDQAHRLVHALTLGARNDTSALLAYRYDARGRLAEEFRFAGHAAFPAHPAEPEDQFVQRRFAYAADGRLRQVESAEVLFKRRCAFACDAWPEEKRERTRFRRNAAGYVAEEITELDDDDKNSRKNYRYCYRFWGKQ